MQATLERDFNCIYLSDAEHSNDILAAGDSTTRGLSNDVSMVGKTFLVCAKSIFEVGGFGSF